MKKAAIFAFLVLVAASPALAQGAQGVGVVSKAAPPTAVRIGGVDSTGKLKGARVDDGGNILTATVPAQSAATSTPLSGSSSTTQTVGPFTPQLGRPINLTLSGTWVGSVQLLRSIDGGTTKLPLTVGGSAWGSYSANANEPVWTETEAGATYYLAITRTSGTISYRIAQ